MKAIIVDDEKHVREGLLLLAEWERFEIKTILEAADGNEAMDLITKHHPEIIFTDMNMPRCDGIDLLKWIHTSNPNAMTIVVSGYDDFKYTKHAITYGSFDYILKPINPMELNETLERAVKKWNAQNNTVPADEFSHEKNTVQMIEEFLRDNYQKDIKLQEIADRFFLSREYISRRFKQETQETLTDYLMKIRVEKAKELLGNPTIKIYQVAEAVGYQNDKYFIKVFKKMEGITPKEYRNIIKKTIGNGHQ
jgi:YesN/AraC family two-component response regulator